MCIFIPAAAGAAAAGSAASAGAAAGTAAAGTAAAGTAAAGTAAAGTAATATTAAASGITAMQAVTMAGTILSGLYGAYAQHQSGKFNAQAAEQNAKMQDAVAQDAVMRGSIEANKVRARYSRVAAAQQGTLAANGIDVNSGSALSQTMDTYMLGEEDAQTTQANGLREAYGYSVNAANSRTQGSIAKAQGNNAAVGTLLTTATNTFAGGYKMYSAMKTKKLAQQSSVWDYMMRSANSGVR